MDLSTKKPFRRPSRIVASLSSQSRDAAGGVDGGFRLSFAEFEHWRAARAMAFGIFVPISNKPILPC
jgi:hypothetical protein